MSSGAADCGNSSTSYKVLPDVLQSSTQHKLARISRYAIPKNFLTQYAVMLTRVTNDTATCNSFMSFHTA